MNKALIIAGIAFFFAIIALIISIVAEVTKEASNTEPKVVATENGFMGTIKDQQVTIETSVTGLLTGLNNGIQSVSSQDITKQILTGYKAEDGTITSYDSILTSIGKLATHVSPSYSSKTSLQPYLSASADISVLSPGANVFCTTVVLDSIAIVTFEQILMNLSDGPNMFFIIELPISSKTFGSQNPMSIMSCIRNTASGSIESDVPMEALLTSANAVRIQNITANTFIGAWLLSCCLVYSV